MHDYWAQISMILGTWYMSTTGAGEASSPKDEARKEDERNMKASLAEGGNVETARLDSCRIWLTRLAGRGC